MVVCKCLKREPVFCQECCDKQAERVRAEIVGLLDGRIKHLEKKLDEYTNKSDVGNSYAIHMTLTELKFNKDRIEGD